MPKTKQRLTRDRILHGAIAFADREGTEVLTMRKVAGELGVGAMSLYNHIENKQDLLVGMVDLVVAKIPPPPATDDWRADLHASADAAKEVLLTHPWAPLEWSRQPPGPARMKYLDALLAILHRAPLPPRLLYQAYHAVSAHIVGFTLQQIGYQAMFGTQSPPQALQDFLDHGAEGLPHMARFIQAHLKEDTFEDAFQRVLDLLLDGILLAAGDET